MTDEEYQKLKSESDAAWIKVQETEAIHKSAVDVWLPIHQKLDHAKRKRELLAEIAAEKGQA